MKTSCFLKKQHCTKVRRACFRQRGRGRTQRSSCSEAPEPWSQGYTGDCAGPEPRSPSSRPAAVVAPRLLRPGLQIHRLQAVRPLRQSSAQPVPRVGALLRAQTLWHPSSPGSDSQACIAQRPIHLLFRESHKGLPPGSSVGRVTARLPREPTENTLPSETGTGYSRHFKCAGGQTVN